MAKANKELLRWIWQTSEGLRTQTLLNAVTGVTNVGLDFAFIYSSKWAIDIATGKATAPLSWAAYTLVTIMVGKILLGFGGKWISATLGVRSQNKIQLRLFSHLLRSEWDGLEARHSGDVLNRLERDVNDVTSTITETLPSILEVTVRLVGAFLFLYTMDAALACLLVCIAPVFILLSKVYVKRMRSITREIRDTDSRIQSILQESIQHHVILKTLEQVPTMIQRLSTSQQQLRQRIHRRTLFSSTSALLLNVGFGAGYLLTFLWGASRLQQGIITYGMMAAFLQLVGQIQGPFRDMTRFIPILISSLTASERLIELQETPLEPDGQPISFDHGAGIRFDNVTYAYHRGGRQIIRHLTYDFPMGSTTAILGETGVGKTTLIRLILALLKPQEGTVEIYDRHRSICTSPQTRNNLVYVPQGNTLFSGTIRDNLLLGNPHATEQEMREVLQRACAHFILERPDGLDTPCGELGAGLSEGQAQRIAIARALLRKGSILLLDEATSALDMQTEQQLLQNLSQHNPTHQTIICITHRPAVIQYCTQVLELKKVETRQ